MNILIIRLSSLGDIILTFPLITLLKEKYPDSKMDFLVKKEYEEILNLVLKRENIITFSKDEDKLGTLKTKIKSNKYDIIIDLHNNLRSKYLRLFNTSEWFRFKKHSLRKYILVKFKYNYLKNLSPIWKRYIDATKELFFEYKQSNSLITNENHNSLSYFKDKVFDKEILNLTKGKLLAKYPILTENNLVGFISSSKHFTKMYPSEYYIELGKRIVNDFDCKIVLFGDKNDFQLCQKIKNSIGNNCTNFAGELNLIETTVFINSCKLTISNDTGLMHIANLLGKNLIAIFGSTVKEFGFFPSGENVKIFEVEKLSCRPCSHIGRNTCPKGHFKCMKDIPLNEIIKYAINFLRID